VAGFWLPHWLLRGVGTPARALVLADLAWWADPEPTGQRARAGRVDAQGVAWVEASRGFLAARTRLPTSTVESVLAWLKAHELVLVGNVGHGAAWLRINPTAVARLYFEETQDEVAYTEFVAETASHPTWITSQTRQHAFHTATGTTLHASLAAVVKDLPAALVLSQLLFWFGDARKHVKAEVRFNQELWWVTSAARLGKMFGMYPQQVRHILDRLESRGLVHRCVRLHQSHSREQVRRWTFLRPAFRVLRAEVRDVIAAWSEAEDPDVFEEQEV